MPVKYEVCVCLMDLHLHRALCYSDDIPVLCQEIQKHLAVCLWEISLQSKLKQVHLHKSIV